MTISKKIALCPACHDGPRLDSRLLVFGHDSADYDDADHTDNSRDACHSRHAGNARDTGHTNNTDRALDLQHADSGNHRAIYCTRGL